MKKTLNITGMMCPKCCARAEKALNELEGVTASVDLESATASCECAESVTDEALIQAVANAGYTVTSVQ